MAETINCNYSRVALHELWTSLPNQRGAMKKIVRSDILKVVEEYNRNFSEQGSQMKLLTNSAHISVRQILTFFNKRWHPKGQKKIFLDIFSFNSWQQLSKDDKGKHSIRNCVACPIEHASLTKSFPSKSSKRKQGISIKKAITFNEDDLSSASSFGKKALMELNTISQQHFQGSASEILSDTPRSQLIKKPSSQEKQSEKRKIVRETNNVIQVSMDQNSLDTVMSNRLSWRKFDKIRKSNAFEKTPTRKQTGMQTNENALPATKRKHGTVLSISKHTQDELILKAQSWGENEVINWSALAREYGIAGPNGGQSIKEFLREHSIPAAFEEQRMQRSARRKRKTLPGGIPFPMPHHSAFQRKQLFAKVESGEVIQGESVVPVSVPSLTVNKPDKQVVQTMTEVFAKKIPLLDIREKLLIRHEKLGIIRTDSVDQSLSRYLKVWHDHSSVAGHGHLLVLVSAVYDTSFYLTQEEATQLGVNIDIQSTVETPKIHILGRSSSSLDDQSLFSSSRIECISRLSSPLQLNSGIKVYDILRFFHGDGPAQQFESGNSVGGIYCCVGCGVHWDRIDDIAYAYRCQQLNLKQRREFLLEGVAWKKIKERPLDNLLLADLKKELSLRGMITAGQKKPSLEKAFEEIRLGINNFPALCQNNPEATLESLNLQNYEVFPTEPLHDLKGHLGNIIEETLAITTGETQQKVKEVKAAVLSKDTVRCSDLHKAVILIYLKLKELNCDVQLTELYRTAVEMSSFCYMHESQRTQRTILRMHNISFLHAYLCTVLFSNPKSTTRRRMFGRFFHSLTVHAALLFRIISLRSLNTEQHERMFQKAKGIT